MSVTPPGLIDPALFPFRSADMNLPAIDTAADSLRRIGRRVYAGTDAVGQAWDVLPAGYEAPEQERVYALMGPVVTSGDELAVDLARASSALSAFGDRLAPLRVRLMDLEERAQGFRDGVALGVKAPLAEATGVLGTALSALPLPEVGWTVVPWDQDTDTVIRNNDLLAEHAALVEEITGAAAACANELTDLVPGYEEPDLLAVPAEALLDRNEPMAWGAPVAEYRNGIESVENGAYAFGYNMLAMGLALGGYDLTTGETPDGYARQTWMGLGNALMSVAVAGGMQQLTARNSGLATLLQSNLPAGAQEWLVERQNMSDDVIGGLVGVDAAAGREGGDPFWRWHEDGISTGVETGLNIATMFLPSGAGVAGAALRTGSVGSRVLRLTAGAADVVLAGGSWVVAGGAKAFSALRRVSRFDLDLRGPEVHELAVVDGVTVRPNPLTPVSADLFDARLEMSAVEDGGAVGARTDVDDGNAVAAEPASAREPAGDDAPDGDGVRRPDGEEPDDNAGDKPDDAGEKPDDQEPKSDDPDDSESKPDEPDEPDGDEPDPPEPERYPGFEGIQAHDELGGHTQERHVENSEKWLRDRLDKYSYLKSSSSFATLEDANRFVEAALSRHREAISAWASSGFVDKPPQVQTTFPLETTGITVRRGVPGTTQSNGITVVLRPDAKSPLGWRVQSAFPDEVT